MANMLIELGSIGRPASLRGSDALDFLPANFRDIAFFVRSWENPAEGYGITLDELPETTARSIVALTEISRKERESLVKPDASLADRGRRSVLARYSTPDEEERLAGDVGRLAGGLSDIIEKYQGIAGIVGNDTIAKLLGGISGLIPGASDLLGPALSSLTGTKPATTTTSGGTAPAASTGFGLSDILSLVIGVGKAAGTQSTSTQAATAVKTVDPKATAPASTPAVSSDMLATLMKAFGQTAALNNMAVGSQVAGGLWGNDVTALINAMQTNPKLRDAVLAGQNDIVNSAALTGQQAAVLEAIRRGTPSDFPIVPVAIGGGAVVLTLLAVAVVGRR